MKKLMYLFVILTSMLVFTSCEKEIINNIIELKCNIKIKNVTTFNGNDGSIIVDVLSGTPPYNFKLIPNNTENTTGIFNNLVDGKYIINVFDSNNQIFIDTVYINTINYQSTTLKHKGWKYLSSNPIEKSNMIIEWEIENIGKSTVENVTAILWTFWEWERINYVYQPIIKHNLTFPVGITYISFELNNLPDGLGSDIHIPINIYITGDLSSHLISNSQFIIYPCDDDVSSSDELIENNNIIGSITPIRLQYKLYNNSCHSIEDNTWTLRYRYYSNINDSIPYRTQYKIMPRINSNDSIIIPYYFTSYTPPNIWVNGTVCKIVVDAIEDYYGDIFPLFVKNFTYQIN